MSGRNLSQEIDEVKGRMEEMAAAQTRMEETLQTIKSAVALLAVRESIPTVNETPVDFEIPIGMGYEPLGHSVDDAKQQWMEKMEEKIKAIQGSGTFGSLGVDELCPTAAMVLPRDFKVPDFTKYDGSTNPLLHLRTYVTKMSIWSKNERFLVNFFHESLAGAALEWYIQMDHSRIDSWKDLADAFMNQYKFNIDLAPTREQLGTLQKKTNETFKQYAQRWRTLAAQVQPPLTASEMCSYFLGTLGSPYVGTMAGAAYRDFGELITAGERIEIFSRAGKLPAEQSESWQFKKSFPPKKDPEVSFTQASPKFTPQQNQQPRSNHRQTQDNFPPFPKLSITNAELFERLVDAHLVAGLPVEGRQPPFPAWYNPNITCKYHMGAAGHSIEDCEAFKTAVRRLIAHGKLDIQEETGPNINNNPLHNHEGSRGVGMIEADHMTIKKVLKLQTPMAEIWEGLHKAGYEVVAPTEKFVRYAIYDEGRTCLYHHGCVGHDIEGCWDFKARVQSLMSRGVVQAGSSMRQEEVKPMSLLYVDNAEEEVTNLCHNFEVVKPETIEGVLLRRNVNQIVGRITAKNGYAAGKGLGRHLQETCTPIPVKQKSDTVGIGYEGDLETKSKRTATSKGGIQLISHLSDTFPSPAEVLAPEDAVRAMHHLGINIVDMEDSGVGGTILPCVIQEPLSNWEAEPVIDVVTLM